MGCGVFFQTRQENHESPANMGYSVQAKTKQTNFFLGPILKLKQQGKSTAHIRYRAAAGTEVPFQCCCLFWSELKQTDQNNHLPCVYSPCLSKC